MKIIICFLTLFALSSACASERPILNMHSEREARSLLRGQASESDIDTSLHVEDSPRLAAGSFNRKQGPQMRFTLDAQQSYAAGSPVAIRFTLENLTAEPLYVLKWYTPLEGIKGRIFKVTRDGVEVLYEGPMVKRANPVRDDYVRIGPGESVSVAVDLSVVYDLTKPGEYRAEFSGRIYDVAVEEKTLPRTMDKHQGIDLTGNAVTFRVSRP
ncbi:MAG: hypothetical protein HZB22_07145 [Deltaproteobacteria bacterium]|nr:hypothetical protein [Deltaproteobacteria bacterium]